MKISQRTLLSTAACLTLVLAFSTGCTRTVNFPGSTVAPAAAAEAKLGSDSNENTTVIFKAKHLAAASDVVDGTRVYVLWAVVPDTVVLNLGQIQVCKRLKAKLSTVTPFKKFKLVLTAEKNPTVLQPGENVVMETGLVEAR